MHELAHALESLLYPRAIAVMLKERLMTWWHNCCNDTALTLMELNCRGMSRHNSWPVLHMPTL